MLENHPVLEYIKDFEMEEKQEESTETESQSLNEQEI